MEIKDLKIKKKELENTISKAQNELYVLNEKHIEQLKAKCEKRIGEAYKLTYLDDKSVSYLMIIDTDEIELNLRGNNSFNEYQFKVLIFSLDNIGKDYPIRTKMKHIIHEITKSTKISRKQFISERIDKKEFLEKAKQAHNIWEKKIDTEV